MSATRRLLVITSVGALTALLSAPALAQSYWGIVPKTGQALGKAGEAIVKVPGQALEATGDAIGVTGNQPKPAAEPKATQAKEDMSQSTTSSTKMAKAEEPTRTPYAWEDTATGPESQMPAKSEAPLATDVVPEDN